MSLDLKLRNSEINFKVDKPGDHKVYEFDDFRLDAGHLMVYRGSEELGLTPKAVETLLCLIVRRGEIVSKDELMSSIWTDAIVEESNLSQYLHHLRKTLGKRRDGKPFIETLKRRGYRFNGDVTVSAGRNGSTAEGSSAGEDMPRVLAPDDSIVPPPNQRVLRVHKRGNVLAVAEWKEAEPCSAPEPQIEHQAATAPFRSGMQSGHRRIVFGTAVAGALLVGALSIFWLLSASGADSQSARGDLTILNLTSGEAVEDATISPDGRYFAYTTHDGERSHLWVQQTGQSVPREITQPFVGATRGASFSTDSEFVYFVVDEGRAVPWSLYRVPAFGGVRTKLLTEISTPVSFSPDGREMVFMNADAKTGESVMTVASSDGTDRRAVLTRTGEDAESMNGGGAWSPDGRLIAYGRLDLKTPWTGSCTIVAMDMQSSEIWPLSPEKWDTCYRMAWTRDGRGLVFVGTKTNEGFSTRRDQIYYVSIATGESHRVTTDGSRHHYVGLSVTENDEILAVPQNHFSQIWSMQSAGDSRSAIQITKGFADGRGGIAPLTNGRVAYLTRNGDGFSIWQTNADGTDRRPLTTEPPQMHAFRGSADGSFFIFSAQRDGWEHLYRVDEEGANPVQLTFGERNDTGSTISPDGNWIIYDSTGYKGNERETGLWRIPSGGGEPMRLPTDDCITPHFSPDGEFVSCVSKDWKTIFIISPRDGELIKNIRTAEGGILNAGSKWTPDGKALTYVVQRKNVGNIWLHPIDGGEARPLTDFTSGEIYNHAFSIDGSRLFLARGYPTRNAILIKGFR